MLVNEIHAAELNSSVQTFKARVELYKGSALEKICDCGETLSDFTVERTGEGKFFGFGICQKLKTNLMDENKELNITKEHTIEASFGVGSDYIYPFPVFYVDEVERDEETQDLTITAYDALYKAENHTVSELILPNNYTLEAFLAACAQVLDLPINISALPADAFSGVVPGGANFDGTETLRQALNAIAEATQSIYFINNNWELTFKRLDKEGEPVFTIDRNNYFDLKTSGARVLGAVVHTTQLEDSVSTVEPGEKVEGATQYVRDNPFWDLREDIGDLVEAAQAVAAGISIEQFECDWFGNYLLEIGDKIKLVSKDNRTLTSYFLEDSITFNGAIEQYTSWIYNEDEAETAANPTSLGEALNKTYARVDKVNKNISLVASEANANSSSITALKINTDNLNSYVEKMEVVITDGLGNLNEDIVKLRTDITQTEADVKILIQQGAEGINELTTETGYTFNSEGLTISKSDSEISTQITEDGMTILKDNEEVLIADNQGVIATDLHAKTYLIINGNSRFENYESPFDGSIRTGCFWIGG